MLITDIESFTRESVKGVNSRRRIVGGLCGAFSVLGTGGAHNLSQQRLIDSLLDEQPTGSIIVVLETAAGSSPVDVRLPDQKNILEGKLEIISVVFSVSKSELAQMIGVTRQSIYNWLSGTDQITEENLDRVQSISELAERIRSEPNDYPKLIFRMKLFDGRSLLDLLAAKEESVQHVEELLAAAAEMDKKHKNSGVFNSDTVQNENWKSSVSISSMNEE